MSYQDTENHNNEPIVLGDDAEVKDITIEAAQGVLPKGTVMGEVTADPGVYIPSDPTAIDGTQLPKIILAEDLVNDVAQQDSIGYITGLFDENQLAFGGAGTIDSRLVIQTNIDLDYRDCLRMFGLRTAPGISVSEYENA